jgi:DNA-binding transcriptional ArsR family regulator
VTLAVETTVEQAVAMLAKALGHPARVRIVRLLLASDACYCASRTRLAELHELVGGILDEAVELADDRRRGCD